MDFYSGSLLLTSIASLALGLFVYLKGKDKPANATLGLFSASLALWCFGQFMGGMVADKSQVLFWTRAGIGGAIFIPIFYFHFIAALVGRINEAWLRLGYGLAFLLLFLDFTPLFIPDVQPVLSYRYYPKAGIVYPYFALFIAVCFGYGFLRLFKAYREAAGEKRNQLLYIIIASLIGFGGGLTAFFPVWGINFPVLSHFALPLYVLVAVYAIVKHHLLDISIIVREGLIYSALTVLFAGFYVLAVLVANYSLSRFVPFDPVVTVLIVVFASVLVFQPVKDRVQSAVDRVFFRGEYRYRKTIDDLSEENRQLFRSLLQADKLAALGTLSAGIAHEIKNPLASIKGLTQVLEENLGDPEFIRKYQEIVPRQIDRLNSLVEKMMRLGQPQELVMQTVDLKSVIEDVLKLLENQLREKKILVELKAEPLPELRGDAGQLSQVFTNFFLNAIQAMLDGGRLSVGMKVEEMGRVCIEVSDNGAGIEADKLDKIFDPFFTTKNDGSGLGLAVVYRIIKEHNGDVQVESKPGKGTKFTVWLPIRPKRSA
ncbi:MAG: ATP-binding protein [Candidatus Margulisbacteria bacterium]|nr:ATP-binding protein [Candidatus Margulisiibacteriota bacterium]